MIGEVRAGEEAVDVGGEKKVVGPGRWMNAGLWALQVGLAAFFLTGGVSKLFGAADMMALFDMVGVGQWLRFVTGALEVLGGGSLLVPGLAGVGAALLSAVLLGATGSHVFLIGDSPLMPLSLVLFVAVVLWGRRHELEKFATARQCGRNSGEG